LKAPWEIKEDKWDFNLKSISFIPRAVIILKKHGVFKTKGLLMSVVDGFIFKTNLTPLSPCFDFKTKTGVELPKTGATFYCIGIWKTGTAVTYHFYISARKYSLQHYRLKDCRGWGRSISKLVSLALSPSSRAIEHSVGAVDKCR